MTSEPTTRTERGKILDGSSVTGLEHSIAKGYSRLADFVFDVTDTDGEPRPPWRKAVLDTAADLDRIACNPLAHPDDRDRARLAMGSLARIWLSVEEAEALYFGGDRDE